MSKILDVLKYFNIEPVLKNGKYHIECPSCGKLKPSYPFWIDEKNDTFNCARCGFSGGFVSLFFYLEYGYEMQSGSRKQYAAEVYKKMYGECNNTKQYTEILCSQKVINEEPKIASLADRDKTYSELLNTLCLSKKHKMHLMSEKRGLDEKQIKELGYKSVPKVTRPVVKNLQDKGCVLSGVPGFYLSNTGWDMVKSISGIMLPIRSISGQIEGFQILNDNPEYSKYPYFSSGNIEKYPKGTSCRSWVHCQGNVENAKEIIITEGLLKADIVYKYTGIPIISLLGVASQSLLLETLQKLDIETTFHVCFDMDKGKNYHVYKALYSLCKKLSDNNLKFYISEWPSFECKGIDDYVINAFF